MITGDFMTAPSAMLIEHKNEMDMESISTHAIIVIAIIVPIISVTLWLFFLI